MVDNYPLGFAMGIVVGMILFDEPKISEYTFNQADLNGDGIKQEMIVSNGNKQIAYFPNTNENYVVRENFDFSSLTNLEAKVEAGN